MTSYSVLIIDDNVNDRLLFKHFLQQYCADIVFTCQEASTGKEGLRLLQTRQFECVLLDQNLPDSTGLEILSAWEKVSHNEKNTKNRYTPFILLTGQGSEIIAAQSIKTGAYNYLTKDLVNSELLGHSVVGAINSAKLKADITYTRQQNKKAEAINKAILNSSIDCILTLNQLGKIEIANPYAIELFGLEPQHLNDLNINSLVPELNLRKRADITHNQYWEATGVKLNGYRFPVELSLTRLNLSENTDENYYTCVIRDISSRIAMKEQAQQLLEQTQKRSRDLLMLLNQLKNFVLLLNSAGEIEFINQAFNKLIGLKNYKGKHWKKVLLLSTDSEQTLQKYLSNKKWVNQSFELIWVDVNNRQYQLESEIQISPQNPDRKILFLNDVTEIQTLRAQIKQDSHSRLIGNSLYMDKLRGEIQNIAKGDWPVLIEGKTGTGKELVARSIHKLSPRKNQVFLAVNCASLNETLLASQLFGHKRGAFTGADKEHIGFFETANKGSIFLDEIGDMPIDMQASLLRVLQEQEFIRLGESKPRKIDVRFIFATNRNLQERVQQGLFREDLLYRIRVARIYIEPLSNHPEDINELIHAFLYEFNQQGHKKIKGFSTRAIVALKQYSWPGNIRELKNVVQHAVIHCQKTRVETSDLPLEINELSVPTTQPDSPYDKQQDQKQRLLRALKNNHGNRAKAAKSLGIGRATLYRWMDKYKVNP